MVIQVEFYGLARLLAGRSAVEVEVPAGATVQAAISALARLCPALVGPVLLPDLSCLGAGYTFSLDGRIFVEDPATPLPPGAVLLLLPAAAGG